ncbi:cupin domain-containing protein [Paraburkholderia bryophila]|uniref:Mannose-6-phosphate isomerase-like protein (Cupin superfamily) n=1 Tax=Paraburkholderia bryophila TaxID=420952 RepID=A0A7Z0B0X2_9BURK|nr:cupin domain-containing protein [Paraburkholderia bryophila]NYH16308.1 mannose-6-phosphate isomerase-like protein (cupin superfamily) [Paraburkholderia bryophila]
MLIDWTRIPAADSARQGMIRKTVCGEKMSAMKVVVAGGTHFDGRLHHHPHEQMLVVLSGRVSVQIDDTILDAEPGELVFFPSGSLHAVVGADSEGACYYELSAPARTDQLPGWVAASALRY